MKEQKEKCGCVNYSGNGLIAKYCPEHLKMSLSHTDTTMEGLREGLREALRWPKDVKMYATDMDSRDSLTRAVDFVLAELSSLKQRQVAEVERIQFELTPIEESINAGYSKEEALRIWEGGRGYNNGVEDAIKIIQTTH